MAALAVFLSSPALAIVATHPSLTVTKSMGSAFAYLA
jgi:hypothetical protein